jgi:hypothetical protein
VNGFALQEVDSFLRLGLGGWRAVLQTVAMESAAEETER